MCSCLICGRKAKVLEFKWILLCSGKMVLTRFQLRHRLLWWWPRPWTNDAWLPPAKDALRKILSTKMACLRWFFNSWGKILSASVDGSSIMGRVLNQTNNPYIGDSKIHNEKESMSYGLKIWDVPSSLTTKDLLEGLRLWKATTKED